jgi:hypothetical protein
MKTEKEMLCEEINEKLSELMFLGEEDIALKMRCFLVPVIDRERSKREDLSCFKQDGMRCSEHCSNAVREVQ